MQVLDAAGVAELLPEVDCLGAMRGMFAALSRGDVEQPPQIVTPIFGTTHGGDFITYLSAMADPPVFGAKLSPYLPDSAGPKVTAWTLLMSSRDGSPLLLCDAMALTVERTAATTALAVDLLAPNVGGKLTVIGSGPIAMAHLRQVNKLRPWCEINCWSPGAASRAAAITSEVPDVVVAPSLEVAVQNASVVMLCTSSATPVLNPSELTSCALVTSITTNAPNAHEIPPDCLNNLDVYCDFAETTPKAASEMRLATENGWSASQIRGDLPTLLSGQAKLPKRQAYFRSVGLGSEDIAIAAALHETIRSQQPLS